MVEYRDPIVVFKLSDTVNCDMHTGTAFIVANERVKKDGTPGRFYTIFPSFKSFLKIRDQYEHCHEILIDHESNKSNIAGRLVFDFDIKDYEVPKKFKKQIENTIYKVIELYYHDVDTDRIVFVWSTSENPAKMSKHLTVKNIYFDEWIDMSKSFYKLFCLVWDKTYDWINSEHLIDFQIVRKHASLRMVGSSKIGGNVLKMDNETHKLTDSLIRIYFKGQREEEQLVTKDNINKSVIDEILVDTIKASISTNKTYNSTTYSDNVEEINKYDNAVYKLAFDIYNNVMPNVFKIGKICGNSLHLFRNQSCRCIICNRGHEQENAILIIKKMDMSYYVYFKCWRSAKRIIPIGQISLDCNEIEIEENFNGLKEFYGKKKKNVITI